MKNYPTREAARSALIKSALVLARTRGYQAITLTDAAVRCGRSKMWACNVMQLSDLQDAVMQRACEIGDLRVIAQGLATRHPVALALPEDVRRAAGEALV